MFKSFFYQHNYQFYSIAPVAEGTKTTVNSNFGNAKVFRSKRNYAAKLTLPAAGNYDSNGTLTNRASTGAYWTTTEFNGTTSNRLIVNQNSASTGAGTNNRNFGLNIRCIAVQ